MKIITWNIRGLGSTVKKRFLSMLIKERSPGIFLVQETKLESVEVLDIQKLWGKANVDFVVSGAVGKWGVC